VALDRVSRHVEVRAITRRVDSGSSRSPIAVEPATSQKSTVIVFLSSRAGGAEGSTVAQAPQKQTRRDSPDHSPDTAS